MNSRILGKVLNEWRLYLFVVPAVLAVVFFSYVPALSALQNSFYEWAGGPSKRLVGFANYARMASDPVLWSAFGTVAILVVFNLFKMIPSIFLAVLVHRLRSDRAQYVYRVLLVIPMIVPGLVTLFIWKFFFDPNFGALNQLLEKTGITSLLVNADQYFGWNIFRASTPIGWLSQPELILPSLFIWGFPWIGAVGVLIYLAGLQSISREIYEAAELDGVGPIGKFFHIELPLILTQVRLSLILLVVATFHGYGLQLMLLGPNGGPGGRGMTPGLWMYQRAFLAGEFGYACAIGIILFAAIVGLTWINNRYVRIER